MENKNTALLVEPEHLVTHLQMLGYWPVKWKSYVGSKNNSRGVRNNAQVISYQRDRVWINPVEPGMEYTDIEWWELTDVALRAIAYSLDNTLVGW